METEAEVGTGVEMVDATVGPETDHRMADLPTAETGMATTVGMAVGTRDGFTGLSNYRARRHFPGTENRRLPSG